jgi:predicted nucleic acid-binding protein
MLVDAGPLIAMLHSADEDHERCIVAAESIRPPMITSWVVLAEAMHVLGRLRGWRGQRALWKLIADGVIELGSLGSDDAARAADLMQRFRDQPMDLGDATLVVLAEQLNCHRVFTLDRHFRAYRLKGRRAFEILPD